MGIFLMLSKLQKCLKKHPVFRTNQSNTEKWSQINMLIVLCILLIHVNIIAILLLGNILETLNTYAKNNSLGECTVKAAHSLLSADS